MRNAIMGSTWTRFSWHQLRKFN